MGFSYGFRRAGVVALSLLAGVLTWTAPLPSEAAAACRTAVPGEVVVLQGSVRGLAVTGRKIWTGNSAGIPGTAQPGDGFGSRLTTAGFGGRASPASSGSR
jgi:hypothetical protein